VEDNNYEDGSRDHDEPVDDGYEGNEIGNDSINEHTDTITPEDMDMHGNVDRDDIWDEQTANESLSGDDDTRIDADVMDNHAPTGSETDIQAIMDERYGARNGRYNLRPRRERNADGYNAILFNTSPVQEGGYIQGFTLTQYNVKQGLKIFGKAGELAVSTELEQVHSRKVIEPKHPHELTNQERANSLRYLMFLKEKHTGQIKGRGCADGRKQRLYMQKEETSSPTVAVE